MDLFYDPRDGPYHERIGSRILYWLTDLDAVPLDEAGRTRPGFLFAGARPIEDYRDLVTPFPLVRDRPEERKPLLRLGTVLPALDRAGVRVPMPRTWVLPLGAPLPGDLAFRKRALAAEEREALRAGWAELGWRRLSCDERDEYRDGFYEAFGFSADARQGNRRASASPAPQGPGTSPVCFGQAGNDASYWPPS